jgi:hypothetical protein
VLEIAGAAPIYKIAERHRGKRGLIRIKAPLLRFDIIPVPGFRFSSDKEASYERHHATAAAPTRFLGR